ncbi:cellulase family glycosylhydrolase [Haloferax sp. MBLA0076]|uniref:Cellulase family glycosylhydrolase n=1 Tax=Haloferax litoreum TaxID=2666140 RepID=A0A6A8GK45_9EURY|nr:MULTISPECIES: cellulase family glycosylhydrolase [Haloferax]KAB1190496.1 cellulase family glycosylhydrolase [Haloferax sp. CBA1148]MRX23475.1 cellulase family glycosylhydrolase [Haloferax litoreum]
MVKDNKHSGSSEYSSTWVGRRTFLKASGVAVLGGVGSTFTSQTERDTSVSTGLTDIRGANYFPSTAWNAYQTWAFYDNSVVERELDMAKSLGLNALRVFASYEQWVEDGPSFFSRMEHFLSECAARGIRPIVVLFEAPPKGEPTEYNRTATDPTEAFGVHSPSRQIILQPRRWSGYTRSPLHFARWWAQKYATDSRLLATEIMNEPGDVQPRQDFVHDVLHEVRKHASSATLTMGCKDFQFNHVYDTNDELDVHQFHMNLPRDSKAADAYLQEARAHRQETGKPLWCTEWQRTLTGPPNRFLPNYTSLAATIENAHDNRSLDGDFFWGLMLKPAYLRDPRSKGRVNGVFHPDGTPFDVDDYAALSNGPRYYPTSWDTHSFPYPNPSVSDD